MMCFVVCLDVNCFKVFGIWVILMCLDIRGFIRLVVMSVLILFCVLCISLGVMFW